MRQFFDAFISYGRPDSKEFATKLQASLNEKGFRIWFDFNDIPLGVDFQNQIDDGIEKAHHFLFIISPHSVNSDYCLKEIELAVKYNKRIIPILHVEEISRELWQQRNPNGSDEQWKAEKSAGKLSSFQNMHPTIRKINWVNFRERIDNFELSLQGLINILESHTDYVEQHTKFLAKALQWERNQQQTNYLLVGEEKQQAQDWLKIHFKDEQPPCLPTDLHCEYITESIKNGNNLMTQVLISYADQDRKIMEKIRTSLRRESITVWTNLTDINPGEDFHDSIQRGILKTDNLIYLLSPDALNSKYCQQELDLAISWNKRIIPLLVRKEEEIDLPSSLRNLQYIDLTDNLKEDDYLSDESQLLKILQEDANYYNQHKIILTQALKWEQQNYNPSILLRGNNLQSAKTWLEVGQNRTQQPPTELQKKFINASLQQPPLDSLDVFISYSRTDSDLARKLNDALQKQGKMTWFDQESIAPGSDFAKEIEEGIKTCDNFLFILSPRSINSPYCKQEVDYAASLNKRFVTVLYREINTNNLHPDLGKVQWIDFSGKVEDFNAKFEKLIITLDTDREYVRTHSKWLQRSLEWEKKNKNDDLLLRGSEFLAAYKWSFAAEQDQKSPALTTLQKEYIDRSKKVRHISLVFKLLSTFAGIFTLATICLSIYSLLITKDQDWVNSLTFSSDGKTITSSGDNDKVNIWKSEDGIKVANLQGNTFAYSPDGKTIVSGSDDGIVRLWDLEGKLLKEFDQKHTKSVKVVVFSPDGQRIVSGSDDNTAIIWTLEGDLLHILEGHTDSVIKIAFKPDGKTIATASDDKTIKLWTSEGKLIQTINRR
ncbi:TIR domain-containing protein [Okeanomitos corallinicola TIOX110]|uniref:TIR domain-containing protein n=1 Tax=Okeanomitos corallinicola TIOX110 TaxID=3133117 RepID=A0ABZ2UUE5_9CYAN